MLRSRFKLKRKLVFCSILYEVSNTRCIIVIAFTAIHHQAFAPNHSQGFQTLLLFLLPSLSLALTLTQSHILLLTPFFARPFTPPPLPSKHAQDANSSVISDRMDSPLGSAASGDQGGGPGFWRGSSRLGDQVGKEKKRKQAAYLLLVMMTS